MQPDQLASFEEKELVTTGLAETKGSLYTMAEAEDAGMTASVTGFLSELENISSLGE